MCLMVFAIQAHPQFPFVFGGNRDEFYRRPTEPAHWWTAGDVAIWGGRDLEAGGTWLAIDRGGRLAAVTNVRDPGAARGARSRGGLVTGFFEGGLAPRTYLEEVAARADEFSPFNLLVADLRSGPECLFLSSTDRRILEPGPGIHALSNATLDAPWPKVTRIKEGLRGLLSRPEGLEALELESRLFDLLRNRERAPDPDLPATGVPLEWERALSAIHIETPDYGTRSSAVILLDGAGGIRHQERGFAPPA